MSFLAVQWHHTNPEDPIWLYSELNNERWEIRKVEVFADGLHDWAEGGRSTGAAQLSTQPLPPFEEIALQPDFTPREISREEFEVVWRKARGNAA
jgi:hypothetical protein